MADSEDFAAMFEASQQARRLTRGQTVEGTIVRIGSDIALVDVGAKSEAVLDLAELKDDAGALEAGVGDRIQATVVSTSNGITLSRRLTRRAATDRQIESAYSAGLPVDGTVQAVVKGGYEVKVGHSRAFCPFSQMDLVRTQDPSAHVGHTYTFRIVEYAEAGRNIVLSRRALLEQEQHARAAAVRQSIAAGAVMQGRVVSVRDFGAFVDLGAGVQGLLHVSEMSWIRGGPGGAAPGSMVAVGDEITVMVVNVDQDSDRISLSTKRLTDDPWSAAEARYVPNTPHVGRVTRLAKFGVFVEMEAGIEALMPLSETGLARETDLAKRYPVGADVSVIVLDVDTAARRMRVSHQAVINAEDASTVREYQERSDAGAGTELGSLADKLRSALRRDGDPT